jgi:hypothetical protein
MEEKCNQKWNALLKIFHGIKMDSPDSKEKYSQLKDLVKLDVDMTPRQKDGITERCDNAINGTYGNTKTSDNLGHMVIATITKGQENSKH